MTRCLGVCDPNAVSRRLVVIIGVLIDFHISFILFCSVIFEANVNGPNLSFFSIPLTACDFLSTVPLSIPIILLGLTMTEYRRLKAYSDSAENVGVKIEGFRLCQV